MDQATDKSCEGEPSNAGHSQARFHGINTPQKTSAFLKGDPLLSILLREDAQAGASLFPETDTSNTANTVGRVGMAVKSLGTLESEVLSALYPADGSEPKTFEAIAVRLGMTLDEVKDIADNALRGLRGNGFSRSSTAWN